MPKRRAARGRRGGGNVDRKVAKAVADESDATEVITKLDGSTEVGVGIDEPEVVGDSENEAAVADESDVTELRTDLDGNTEAAVGIDASEVIGDGVNETPGTEDAADEVAVLNDSVTASVLQEQTVEENEDPVCETKSEGNEVTAKDDSESTSVGDIIKEGSDAECTEATESNKEVERDNDAESSMMCQEENEEIIAEKFQQLEASEEGDQPANESELELVENDPVKNIAEEECQVSEQHEEEPQINLGGNEVADMDVSSVDKEAEDQTEEEEEVQYIDEEASEDQPSSDLLEISSGQGVVVPEESELQGKKSIGESIENPIELDESDDVSAGVLKTGLQKDEENDNSKFEEISEGSIDQDQEELIAEPISDVEITGESFEAKKVSKNSAASEENAKPRYKEAESLEEVFFATENDDLKITAEDKDNDDVSDTSLSNHADANLSLEEISDDDLEPSKKRKKSGLTPVKADKAEEKTAPDVDTKSVEKSEVKPNQKSMSVQKRPANDEGENTESSSNKRLKTTNETKDSEGTPSRSENDVTIDAKKDGKKPQAKEIDTFQGRSVPHNRNLSQSSKNGLQESRERAISSRDSVERKKRHEYELVSTMSQTEPRQLKGKIVQCNINPVRAVPEQPERISENNRIESRLLTKFRKQIPSSIPEKIFLAVTSLHPPQLDNAYSFSMGPVTLSDIDCPKFRLTMRNMEDFSLTFDKHTQGIQKATLVNHESLTSLIGHLKNLELGNRYMVMSVVYKCGIDRTVGVWKATLLFMYEQDIQMESLKLVNDGKVRAKLCLKGVPKDVSKDFIHLLFPEAINVCTGQGNQDERSVMLGFSNEKIVEEIVSCYDLLVICGSQITISRVSAKGTQQGLPPDGSEESKAILVEDIQNGGALEKHTNESIEKETEKSDLDSQSKVKNIVIEDSKKNHITQGGQEVAVLSEDATKTQEKEKNGSSTEENKSADSKDTSAEVSQTTSEVILTKLTPAADITAEGETLPAESVADTGTKMQTDEVPVVLSTEKGQQEAIAKVGSAGDESSARLAEAGINKPSDSQLGDVALIETTDIETSKPVQENNADSALAKVVDGLEKIDVDNPLDNLVDDAGKDSSKQDSEDPDVVLIKTAEAAPDTIADVILATAVTDSKEKKNDDESSKTIDGSTPETEVNTAGKEGNQEKLDKNFEDISDEEAGKHCEPDDVVIVTNESPQLMVTEIDLTVEESDTSGIVENVNVKPLAEKKSVRPSSKTEEPHDSTVKKAAGIKRENAEPKLVMTDGDLEISMEVIDVNEDEQQTEKVIYARTYKEFRGRSRERRSWDARSYKNASYVQPPWKESNWPEVNRPAPYYGSHEQYKHYPPKESAYRVPYYPVPPPAPLPEELSYYRAPARESTSYRREPYYLKPKRYRSPSPSRDANLHRHSSSRYSDHRTGDFWNKRYDIWPSAYEDSKKSESYSRPPAEYSGRQAHWQSHSTSHRSPPPSHESLHSSARPKDRYTRGGSRDAYDSDRRRKYRKSRSRSLSDMSISSAELVSPVRKAYRRESPKRPAAHTSRSPISVSSRSHSLSPVSKSPSLEYTHPGTGKDKLVKTVKHFLELAKGIKQTHRRQSNRSLSPKSPPLRRSKSPLYSRHRSPSVSSSLLRKALHGSPRKDSRRQRSRSPHQLWPRTSRSPIYSKRRRHDRSSSASSHGEDYKRRLKERYTDKRAGSYHRQSPDHRYESRKPQKTETSHAVNDQSSKSKSAQWSDSKYKSSSSQSWQQPVGSYPVPQSSGSAATSSVYNPTYPPPGCPPQQQSSVYSGSSVSVYPYNNPSQFYSSIPPPFLHVPPPAPIAQTYQPPAYTVYQPPQPYASLQTGTSSNSLNVSANNASSKTKSWSMGSSAMVFQRVLGPDRKGGKVNKSGVISKIVDRERLERPKVAKTERVLTTIQTQKK